MQTKLEEKKELRKGKKETKKPQFYHNSISIYF